MASHSKIDEQPPLDLSAWRNVPNGLAVGGAVLCAIGLFVNQKQFAFSWLLAFMFFLSLGIGGLFLTLVHHLFDASWSVPIRRINESLAGLLPFMLMFFIPIALFSGHLYEWMHKLENPDHALHAKHPLFTMAGFYIVVAANFAIWFFLTNRLRYWSLKQDETGSAECTFRMRFFSFIGIFLFAITTTLAAVMWVKAMQHEWFSTMYGVCYFAGSVWLTLGTVYLITSVLKRQGPLKHVVRDTQFYFIGSLLFAFTVFHAYVTFSQYFIIWNGNIPEETFYYVLREKGTWFVAGVVIIIGHFFVPFLALLRIDVKHKLHLMLPIVGWAWAMHFMDLCFQIMPVLHPEGFMIHWLDLGALALIGGVLAKIWMKLYFAHPPYPQRDPRIAETMGVHVAPASAKAATAGGAH